MSSSQHTKNWIITSGQDYSPGGALSLEQILQNPWDPASGLLTEGTIPIPASATRDRTTKGSFIMQYNDRLNVSFRLWAEINSAPVAGNISGERDTVHDSYWHIESLSGDIFLPPLSYVKRVLHSGDVPSKTQWWKLRRKVYMVTGLRIAHGAQIESQVSSSSRLHATVEADASSQGVPLSGGGGGGGGRNQSQFLRTESISDFIFAYRLNEVTYRVWTSHKPFTTGQTAGAETKDPGNDSDEDMEPDRFDLKDKGTKINDFDGNYPCEDYSREPRTEETDGGNETYFTPGR